MTEARVENQLFRFTPASPLDPQRVVDERLEGSEVAATSPSLWWLHEQHYWLMKTVESSFMDAENRTLPISLPKRFYCVLARLNQA